MIQFTPEKFKEIPFEHATKFVQLRHIYAVLYYMRRRCVYSEAVNKALKHFPNVQDRQTISVKCARHFAGNVGTFVEWYGSGDMLSKLGQVLKLSENDKNIFSELLGNDVGESSEKGGEETPQETDPPTAVEKFSIDDLYFENEEQIIRQITAALKNGKHIILIGPPGTGKSKLAKEICDFCAKGGYTMTTATSDWSTFDTIGGYMQDESGKLKFSPGCF